MILLVLLSPFCLENINSFSEQNFQTYTLADATLCKEHYAIKKSSHDIPTFTVNTFDRWPTWYVTGCIPCQLVEPISVGPVAKRMLIGRFPTEGWEAIANHGPPYIVYAVPSKVKVTKHGIRGVASAVTGNY